MSIGADGVIYHGRPDPLTTDTSHFLDSLLNFSKEFSPSRWLVALSIPFLPAYPLFHPPPRPSLEVEGYRTAKKRMIKSRVVGGRYQLLNSLQQNPHICPPRPGFEGPLPHPLPPSTHTPSYLLFPALPSVYAFIIVRPPSKSSVSTLGVY